MLRLFERVTADGDTLTNEFKCPLLKLTKSFVNISPQLIFAQLCTSVERAATLSSNRPQELWKETIEENTQTLLYKHDFYKDCYVLNVFCMNQ